MPRILVVDDRPLDAAAAVRLLRQMPDVDVEQLRSGLEALESLEHLECDLVLTDLHMPVIDGLTLMQEIHQRYPQLPVVVMTSRGDERKAVRALEAGAASYLPKARLEIDLIPTCTRVLASARHQRDHAALLEHLVSERFEIELENDRQYVPGLVDFIVGRCIQFRVCERGRSPRIGVAIEEAVINAIVHGNLEVSSDLREDEYERYEEAIAQRLAIPRFAHRHVHVAVHLDRKECRITIRDEGTGFDPQLLRDPTDPENLIRVSGRGILLMRAFLDEVTFNEQGNEVLLVVQRTEEMPTPLTDLRVAHAASLAH